MQVLCSYLQPGTANLEEVKIWAQPTHLIKPRRKTINQAAPQRPLIKPPRRDRLIMCGGPYHKPNGVHDKSVPAKSLFVTDKMHRAGWVGKFNLLLRKHFNNIEENCMVGIHVVVIVG